MQPVLVINKAVEVVKRGNPPRLLLTQSHAVWHGSKARRWLSILTFTALHLNVSDG